MTPDLKPPRDRGVHCIRLVGHSYHGPATRRVCQRFHADHALDASSSHPKKNMAAPVSFPNEPKTSSTRKPNKAQPAMNNSMPKPCTTRFIGNFGCCSGVVFIKQSGVMRPTVIFSRSQPVPAGGCRWLIHAPTLGRQTFPVNLNLKRLRVSIQLATPPASGDFGSSYHPAKDKVTLSLAANQYEPDRLRLSPPSAIFAGPDNTPRQRAGCWRLRRRK